MNASTETASLFDEMLESARVQVSLRPHPIDEPEFPEIAAQYYAVVIRGLLGGEAAESPNEGQAACTRLLALAILAWLYPQRRDEDRTEDGWEAVVHDEEAFDAWIHQVRERIEVLREASPSTEGLFTSLVVRNADDQRFFRDLAQIADQAFHAALREWATDVAATAVRLAEEGDPLLDRAADNKGNAEITNPPRNLGT